MNRPLQDTPVANYGIGQPVRRAEDPILVQGRGTYTDDVNLPGQVYAAFVRSPVAHGIINKTDVTAALAMPGVLAVYTADDLAAYGPFENRMPAKNRDGQPIHVPDRGALARGKVSFVGDPVVCIIASSPLEALDAAEAVDLDIEQLPAVTEPRAAAAADIPPIYDDVPGNFEHDFHFGDSEKVTKAFADAAHIARVRLRNNRLTASPLEPRSIVVAYDGATGRFTVHLQTQGVVVARGGLAAMLREKPEAIRVISKNVGGSFGMKSGIYPEYICAAHAARDLGKPVKWTSTRAEAFLSDHHGRDHDFDVELALDRDGHFLALRFTGFGNMGAYLTNPASHMFTSNAVRNSQGMYRTPLLEANIRGYFTNTTAVAAYRGAGRPEANYYMERLVETAAREMGIDPIELRRRNHIAPDQMPFESFSGWLYDSGNFPAVLDRALEVADVAGFEARKAESAARGKVRGLGIGQFVEATAGVGAELGDIAFNRDGTITIRTGSHDHGQGHWSAFAQVLVDRLGVPFDAIRLMQTDSDDLFAGTGTGGSKSIMSSGNAIAEAAAMVIDKGRKVAAHILEAAEADIEFDSGRFTVAGTDRAVSIMEIARRLNDGEKMPDGVPDSLDVSKHRVAEGPQTFPNGCHVAEVEIDPETGTVQLVRYSSVNDFGVLVNPLLVEGQLHGGIVQGVGQCILEDVRYGDDGQLLTGSFMDYAMPRADHVPFFGFRSLPSPAKTNPLGVKGCGEAGVAGSMTSVMNAIVNALSVYGIRHIDMPATPLRVWEAIQSAKRKQNAA